MSGKPLTVEQMAHQVHALEQPGGQVLFRSWHSLGVFQYLCNRQMREFAAAEPPRPLATLEVDGEQVHVRWHQVAPLVGQIEVYTRPPADDRDKQIEALQACLLQTQEAAKDLARLAATQAAFDVLSERQRQVTVEGWTPEHDDGKMAWAAACYITATPEGHSDYLQWPWAHAWWKPKSRRQNLVRAGALILAEIERLDRAASTVNELL